MGIKYISGIVGLSAVLVACGSSPEQQTPAGNTNTNTSGHTAHGAPPPPPAPLRAGEEFREIGLERAYQPAPPTGGTDEYRCFLIDPKLTEPAFITGSQFLPQNADIVHHAILYRITGAQVEHAKAVDAKADGDGWQCFGGTGLSDGGADGDGDGGGETWIGAWAPGHNETLIGEMTGHPVEPGNQIVMQIHYNLLATNGKTGPSDKSSMRMRMMPGTANVTPLQTQLLPAPIELPCTEAESGPLCDRAAAIEDLVKRTGEQARKSVDGLNKLCNQGKPPVAGPSQHCDIPVRQPMMLYAVAPHMHLLGRSISLELNPGTPGAQKLLDQPTFNFDDQSSKMLPQPVRLNKGDVLRVSCTHDAAIRSQLPELKPLKPRYVVWGDGTSDEMCIAVLTGSKKVS